MTYGGGFYPPGTPGPHASSISLRCVNTQCEHTWGAPATWELGGTFFNDDDDAYCPECGWEGVCDGDTGIVQLYVLVDKLPTHGARQNALAIYSLRRRESDDDTLLALIPVGPVALLDQRERYAITSKFIKAAETAITAIQKGTYTDA